MVFNDVYIPYFDYEFIDVYAQDIIFFDVYVPYFDYEFANVYVQILPVAFGYGWGRVYGRLYGRT